MGEKDRIKEEFDNFKSAYHNLEAMTDGMSEEELELIHKIQVVLKDHEDDLEEAAVNIIAEESQEDSVEDAAEESLDDTVEYQEDASDGIEEAQEDIDENLGETIDVDAADEIESEEEAAVESTMEAADVEDTELIHKIQVVLKEHGEILEEAAINLILDEYEKSKQSAGDDADAAADIETEAESATDVEGEAESGIKSETETEIESELDSEIESVEEHETETESEAESEIKNESEPEIEVEPESESESEVESEIKTETENEAVAEEPELDIKSDTESDIESDIAADNEPKEKPLPIPPVGNRKPDFFDKIEAAFVRWTPKGKLGSWIRKDRHNAFFSIVIVLAIVVGTWQAVDYAIPEDVTVIYETVSKFDKKELKTRSRTVSDVLDESGFDIGEADMIHPIAEKQVEDGMEIRVRHATNAVAKIAGKDTKVLIVPGTVEDNLLLNDIEFDDDDIITPSLNTKITDKTKIEVKEVTIKTVTKKETVKARSVVRLDPKLTSGVEERVNGHDGKAVYEYTTTYINGKKKETKKTVKKWIKKVQDNELRLGTSLTGHTGEFEVKESFTGNTTAYWMGNNARGASGGRCVYGTCAVDPKRIPYGTDMWVEGYGYARANDCGGAIKNDHIDLWMHSYRESCQWGRRFVTVYVLK